VFITLIRLFANNEDKKLIIHEIIFKMEKKYIIVTKSDEVLVDVVLSNQKGGKIYKIFYFINVWSFPTTFW
jgi:hypothetical protein